MGGIIGSYGILIFSFLRNLHNSCNNLHCHQKCISVSISPHPHQHLFLLPLNKAILIGVRWNLSVVLMCISFRNMEVEHFFMYLLAICTTLFENSLLNSCTQFFIGMLILWGWIFWFWILVPYYMNSWKDFLPFYGQSLEPSDCLFCCVEAFYFDAVPFVHSFS
jgi:hypothetical protein